MRNGSRFLELQLRLFKLLRNGGAAGAAAFPPAFDWKTASRQACASMQKNARPRITTPGYDAADAIWQQQHPRSVHGVELLSGNSLTYETNAYFNTLLCNYTKVALCRHVFKLWTLRYLLVLPAHRKSLKEYVIGKVAPAVGNGSTLATDPEWTGKPELAELVKECHAIQEGTFDNALATRALLVRWECLRLIAALKAEVAAGRVHWQYCQWSTRGGVVQLVDILPKQFSLVPMCQKASRFITLDEKWARAAWGLPIKLKAGEVKPAVPYLQQLFASHPVVAKWMRGSVGRRGFPATVKSDGVQLHVPFVTTFTVPVMTTKKAALHKDRKLTDPKEFARQLNSDNPRGLYVLEAAKERTAEYPNAVGVDPGVKNLITTSQGIKLTRSGFYGWRPRRSTFDPGDGVAAHGGAHAAGGRQPQQHSRRTRRCAVPAPIQQRQDQLALTSLRDAGTQYETFKTNLTAWLTSS